MNDSMVHANKPSMWSTCSVYEYTFSQSPVELPYILSHVYIIHSYSSLAPYSLKPNMYHYPNFVISTVYWTNSNNALFKVCWGIRITRDMFSVIVVAIAMRPVAEKSINHYLLKVKPLFFGAFSGVMGRPDSRRRFFSSNSRRCFSRASFICLWRA